MNSQEKIVILNEAASELRNALKKIEQAFIEDTDITYQIYKINKIVSTMHQMICTSLEKQVTKEYFNDIVKNIQDGGEDG